MSAKSFRLGLVVQARMGSQRLPEKVILPMIGNNSILDIMISRLKCLESKAPIIIASGELPKNAALQLAAARNGVRFFSGQENDVLQRFIDCADQFQFTKVLRVCADNPFIDIELMDNLIAQYARQDYDYVSYSIHGKPTILSHYGFFAELVSVDALIRARKASNDTLDLEHVTRFIYNNQDLFSVKYEEVPLDISAAKNIRLTVDTKADFDNATQILEKLLTSKEITEYNHRDVLAAIAQLNPQLKESMYDQIVENSKS
jgi:spore coat polysaccharide biosynthesis protein SpsF